MLNRTSIEEANKHLQALYSRVNELEAVAQEQHDALLAKDSFIRTKIQELSKQDLIIQGLKHKLEEQEKQLAEKNEKINDLEKDLNAKDLHISAMKPKVKALNDLLNIIPDLKTFLSKMEDIAVTVKSLDEYGYIEVSESPSPSEDADNTDSGPVKSQTKPTQDNSNTGIEAAPVERLLSTTAMNAKPNEHLKHHQPVNAKITEDSYNPVVDGSMTVGEMARNFAKSNRSKKFSVSEEDEEDIESEVNNSKTNSTMKELYF